jgi:hypothetical protein
MKAGAREDFPHLNYTAKVVKGNTVYFEGQQFSKEELGDKAYDAIRISSPSFTADIYDGDVFKRKIAFRSVGEEDYYRLSGWLTIFEGDYHPDRNKNVLDENESKKLFFSPNLNFKNIQITKMEASNFHLVRVQAFNSKKN